jgi:PilZ domain-containing protein
MSSEVDGAEYLRHLKQDQPGPQPQVTPVTQFLKQQGGVVERRATPRFKCEGSAQVRAENSDVRTWGSITDVSLHGCYLEMTATFPVGTTVFIQLELGGNRVDVKGEVRVNYPFLGMGIAFREVTPQNRLKLGEMVLKAAREVRLVAPHAGDNQPTWVMPQVSDPKAVVAALGNFFSRKSSLSREEFTRIVGGASAEG